MKDRASEARIVDMRRFYAHVAEPQATK